MLLNTNHILNLKRQIISIKSWDSSPSEVQLEGRNNWAAPEDSQTSVSLLRCPSRDEEPSSVHVNLFLSRPHSSHRFGFYGV